MPNFVQVRNYRHDIDGLRAIAVLSVIFFHFGYLPTGFLGVDVFFVISGYLITGIIYNEFNNNQFSVVNFYLRRVRRILPLTSFISLVSLAIGIATMLPDDLENLAQSVIATNLFSNNILQAITTKNYWDVVNEYKPLMHTWSLGIEEQYYLLYPLLFLVIGIERRAWLLPLLITLTTASLIMYFSSYYEYEKFYLIPFRFYELSIGGIAAIVLKNNLLDHKYSPFFVLGLIFFIVSGAYFVPHELILITTVLLTLAILATPNEKSALSSFILENKLMVIIGTISFSLYMWHQVLLSYARYFLFSDLHATHLAGIFILMVALSVLSYRFIERPFRNKNIIPTKKLLLILSLAFVLANASAFYIYFKGGVLKDIPELNLRRSQTERNMHAIYNNRIYGYDNNFRSIEKIKVLIIGNSFARDWANVLLESKYKDYIEISYIYDPYNHGDLKNRVKESHIVFYSTPTLDDVQKLEIDATKLLVIGTKNFGRSNGMFFNYKGDDYYKQRTAMAKGYLEQNTILRQEWGDKYIDYIGKVIDENQTVPVFTPSHKFISQDCRHLTKAGAQYFAQLFEKDLKSIFDQHQFAANPGVSVYGLSKG